MINQYRDIYDKIDHKVLRPTSFKNAQELYDFLYYFLLDREMNNKEATISRHLATGLRYNYKVNNIELYNETTVKIYLCGTAPYSRTELYVSPTYSSYTFYTNKDKSILMLIQWNSINRDTYIIK